MSLWPFSQGFGQNNCSLSSSWVHSRFYLLRNHLYAPRLPERYAADFVPLLGFQYDICPLVTPKLLHRDHRTGWAFIPVLMSMLFQLYHYWFWILYLQDNSICITMIFNFTAGAKQADWLFIFCFPIASL